MTAISITLALSFEQLLQLLTEAATLAGQKIPEIVRGVAPAQPRPIAPPSGLVFD